MRSLISMLSRPLQQGQGKVYEELEFSKGPPEGARNVWCEVSGRTFHVRSKSYLHDGVKKVSEENALELLEVEIFNSTSGKQEHYARAERSAVTRHTRAGDGRFKLMITFQTLTTHLVVTWAVDERVLAADPPLYKLWNEYIHGTPEFRNARLKVIPRLVDGGFILRRLLGEKPGILGKKLNFRYYQTDMYLEVVCDTVSTAFANRITTACMDQASKLSIDLGFLLEGQTEDELPERMLGAFRMSKPNLSGAAMVN